MQEWELHRKNQCSMQKVKCKSLPLQRCELFWEISTIRKYMIAYSWNTWRITCFITINYIFPKILLKLIENTLFVHVSLNYLYFMWSIRFSIKYVTKKFSYYTIHIIYVKKIPITLVYNFVCHIVGMCSMWYFFKCI